MSDEPEILSYAQDHGPGIPEIPITTGEAQLGDAEEVVEGIGEAWIEDSVRDHLKLVGDGLHMMLGKDHPTAYKMCQEDLDRIAPPLTRIMNRYESLAQFGVVSDPLLLAEGTVLYAGRSMLQVRAAKRAAEERREAQREPLEGRVVPGPWDEKAPPAAPDDEIPEDFDTGPGEETRADRIAREVAELRAQGFQEDTNA